MVMRKRRATYAALCLLLLAAASLTAGFAFSRTPKALMTATLVKESEPPQVNEIHGYRAWTLVNPQPVLISSVVNLLCRAPTQANRDDEARNPHMRKLISVYVNALGQQAMLTERKPEFPVGSVIVKEKFAPDKKDAPELLTVMVKREQGFNPASGDWEYMVTNGAGTKIDARGKIESCQSCHVSMRESGFVYRSYMPDELRNRLR
jgi:hypothetical protein